MKFKEYMHIERFGTTEVENIQLGYCYVMPKIDGTNGSVWLDEGEIKAGSRSRELTKEHDNAMFYAYVLSQPKLKAYLDKHPTHRLFGEWLVPHSLRTYRDEAWKRFYIFDVRTDAGDHEEYIPYPTYSKMLQEFELEYVPAMWEGQNMTYEQLVAILDKNTYLIADGLGQGEGIVIKNYDFYNRYGRQTWAKIVRSEFKELNAKVMGGSILNGAKMVEEEIVELFCTPALVEKVHSKIITETGEWSSKFIPRLLNTVFYDLVREDIWAILKDFKMPSINFKTLNFLCTKKIKEIKPEIFQ